jgi:HEPN domain-containing protein
MKPNSIQILDYEHELNSVFKHYPAELIEASLLPLLPNTVAFIPEELTITQLFYQELNTVIQRCLLTYHQHHSYPEPAQETTINLKNTQAIVKMLKEVIPVGYIFCNNPSQEHCSLTIVLDQYLYQSLEEAQSLINFVLLSHRNISCKLFTYGTMVDLISNGHFYYSNFCVLANCIYQRSNSFNFIKPNPVLLTSTKLNAIANFKQHNNKANNFFLAAQHFLLCEEYGMATFMLQQTCEFTFNAILIALKGKSTKSHNLLILRKQASHYLPQLIGLFHHKPKKEICILNQIQDAYIKARYDEHYRIDPEQLVILITATKQFIHGVQVIFEELAD